jgi:pimeloyl-ACP methyl ester carboxylesterase
VRALAGDHVIYIVTLPGFDGRPFTEGNSSDAARAAWQGLISARQPDHPVLIGQSMSAARSVAVADTVPQAFGGMVAIDGLPIFPGAETMPAAQPADMAARCCRYPIRAISSCSTSRRYSTTCCAHI